MVMNHHCVAMITSMITVVMMIMVVMINTHCHYGKCSIIRRWIRISIRGIIGHINR
jgi:hypothetical protein